ncbi:MAG: DUF2974 domain-containing protein [Clostridiales bacterium]|nr:DUF2974 domain-containing protein [Clostridiales bacterium]
MTETQILMLNNLIYDPVFTSEGAEAFSVGELLSFIDTDQYKKQGGLSGPATTKEEWENMIRLAKEDEQLCRLRLAERKNDPRTGAKAICFYDEETDEAAVVFSGTGYNEWRDNFTAGTQTDTKQQIDALEWFETLDYENITVSGHSKGGNKAMYIAVCSEKEVSCVAFDGEGFSKEFCEKYQEKIEERKENIVLYANYRDFVSCLLYPIAGNVIFLENDGGIAPDELSFGGYHCPDALFLHKDGEILYALAEQGEREAAIQLLAEFTIYFMEKTPKGEKVQILSFLGDVMQRLMGKGKGEYRNDIVRSFGADALRDILIYFRSFLKEKEKSDPEGYQKGIKSFADLANEFLKIPSVFKLVIPVFSYYSEKYHFFPVLMNKTIPMEKAVVIRDFTQETKERMIEAAKERDREPFWKISRWDCWYRLEQEMTGLNLSAYANNIDEYYRKLIDLNDAGTAEIERIFEDVAALDLLYAEKIAEENINLKNEIQKLQKFI